MERTRPLYCCLTEGSGGAGSSRMPSTDEVLDVHGALERFGRGAFAVECLRPVTAALAADIDSELPFYERYGEQRVPRRPLRRDHPPPAARAARARGDRGRRPQVDRAVELAPDTARYVTPKARAR